MLDASYLYSRPETGKFACYYLKTMSVPLTKQKLIDWAGRQMVKDAEVMLRKGQVLESEYDPPYIHGSVLWNNRALETGMRILDDGTVESECPCYTNKERGLICAHVIALGLSIVERHTDPLREVKYQEEVRRASRLAEIEDKEYIQRVPQDTPGACPARLQIGLGPNWLEGLHADSIPLRAELLYRKKHLLLDEVPKDIPFTVSREDEALLFVLEDISEGPAKGNLTLNCFDFANILRLHRGKKINQPDGNAVTVNDVPLQTILKMDLDTDTGQLILKVHTEIPFTDNSEEPNYLIAGRSGWICTSEHFWPLEKLLPAPYHTIYRSPVIIDRCDVLRFMQRELPELKTSIPLATDISIDLFTIDPASPRFHLEVKGSLGSLSATLFARYGNIKLVACRPDPQEHFGLPDPNDIMRYTVRNIDAEQAALIRLRPTGFSGACGNDLSSIVGNRNVLNFLASHLPALRRKGWEVTLEGRAGKAMDSFSFVTPVVHITDDHKDSFDVGIGYQDTSGASLSQAEISNAIRKGEFFLKKGSTVMLIDSDAVTAMENVFSDCATTDGASAGHFRMSNVHAAFIKSSLDALDGIDVEDTPEWRVSAEKINKVDKIEPVSLGEPLEGILRPYQKEGVNWLRFLEAQSFCGLLADEMGLGKTLQTLAWLQLPRLDDTSTDLPSIIVCPTSLVENWAEEIHKFVPSLQVLIMTGPERHDRWDHLQSHDVVITSYALLRRDSDRYTEHQFAVAILDEAQHIKNRSTQNAAAAKQLRAIHRVVLTGTPIENSVSDLWSIMDFLMPGYLNSHQHFRQHYELPISHGPPEGDIAQVRLRRKMQPFTMRRLKVDVAKDLPPRIEKVAHCSLSADQRLVYDTILKESRRKLSSMVSKKGFNKCRMQILATLTRLRQACCHLDLLKLPDLRAKNPSAKTDMLFELVNEAMDGRHRILVFSQFVTMLTCLRNELDTRGIQYCYLDGQTKDRMGAVREFNTNRDIPLFLISLKAGGTGLNLTGADMVIHFDPWWNPAVEDQATDRAHRIGQKRTVYSVKLISRNTIEEKVLDMQRRKQAVIDATIEATDSDIPKNITWDDVQELLSI